MKYINFLIKPASSLCNMRCRYCFYEDEAASRSQHNMGIMDVSASELLIREALASAGLTSRISFAFQGGEPTLAGLDYFRHFVDYEKTHNFHHIPVQYSIQTNGLALDAEWASFLAKNHFLVGISLDGDKILHDRCRVDASGKGTWNRVTRAISLLQKAKTDLNLLCVVTRDCARSAVRVYHALQKTGVRYLQFIPCLDPIDQARGSMTYSLLPENYGNFLCALFDEWFRDWQSGHYTSVRLFDDYVHLMMGQPASTCSTSGSCGAYFVVEADGSIYPCDFYSLDEWKLGYLGDQTLESLSRCDLSRRFLQEGLDHPAACTSCPWQGLCFGGCKRDWYTDPATGEKKNYYCPAFQRFFAYAAPRLREIAQEEWAACQSM